jgi:hypothetical protein
MWAFLSSLPEVDSFFRDKEVKAFASAAWAEEASQEAAPFHPRLASLFRNLAALERDIGAIAIRQPPTHELLCASEALDPRITFSDQAEEPQEILASDARASYEKGLSMLKQIDLTEKDLPTFLNRTELIRVVRGWPFGLHLRGYFQSYQRNILDWVYGAPAVRIDFSNRMHKLPDRLVQQVIGRILAGERLFLKLSSSLELVGNQTVVSHSTREKIVDLLADESDKTSIKAAFRRRLEAKKKAVDHLVVSSAFPDRTKLLLVSFTLLFGLLALLAQEERLFRDR